VRWTGLLRTSPLPPYLPGGATAWRLRLPAQPASRFTGRPAATEDRQIAGHRVYIDGRSIANDQAYAPIMAVATTSGLACTDIGREPRHVAHLHRAGGRHGWQWTELDRSW